jgi:hypothetical protein
MKLTLSTRIFGAALVTVLAMQAQVMAQQQRNFRLTPLDIFPNTDGGKI